MREPHIRIRFETLPDCLHLLPHGAEGLRVSDLVKELFEALRPRPELQLGEQTYMTSAMEGRGGPQKAD